MITGINELKTLTKHVSCQCKFRFDGRKCNSDNGGIMINVNVNVKKHDICDKDYPDTCNCENGKYLASIMDDSTIVCDEIINVKEANFNEKNITCKTQNFYILLAFLLITIVLLIAIIIYCYLMKYQGKNSLTFHNTNNKLNKFYIDSINRK